MAEDARRRIASDQRAQDQALRSANEHFNALAEQLDRLLGECRVALRELKVEPVDLKPLPRKASQRKMFQKITHRPTLGWWFTVRITHDMDHDSAFVVHLYLEPQGSHRNRSLPGRPADGSWAWASKEPWGEIAHRIGLGKDPLVSERETRSYLSGQVTKWAQNGQPF
ncbi:hypothetical protein ACNHUS_34820 [Actinomycetes bacterium M1A6_2h]